jgi:hypothetical protein
VSSSGCILHWNLNHFVVLKRTGRDGIEIHDPASGVQRVPLGLVSKQFTGVALELTPVAPFEPAQAPPRIRLRSVIGHMVGLRSSIARVFLLALTIEAFAVISPFFLQWVVDHALLAADRDLLLILAVGFWLLMLMRTAIIAMRGWMLMELRASLTVQGPANLFTHLINLPASYFEARYLADVMSRFGSQDTIMQVLTANRVADMTCCGCMESGWQTSRSRHRRRKRSEEWTRPSTRCRSHTTPPSTRPRSLRTGLLASRFATCGSVTAIRSRGTRRPELSRRARREHRDRRCFRLWQDDAPEVSRESSAASGGRAAGEWRAAPSNRHHALALDDWS